MVYFVGAGSGAVDLIPVRGQRLLRQADVVIYAGSLVNPQLLQETRPDCRLYNSAKMTLEEVLELCLLDERLIPCIDFGHLNARTFGALNSFEGIRQVFETMENVLGLDRMRQFHAHFSKIEYTEKGGEKCHLTFADTVYGPQFEPVAEMIVRKNASPTIICESAGTQAEDAATMKRMYAQALAACGQAE